MGITIKKLSVEEMKKSCINIIKKCNAIIHEVQPKLTDTTWIESTENKLLSSYNMITDNSSTNENIKIIYDDCCEIYGKITYKYAASFYGWTCL